MNATGFLGLLIIVVAATALSIYFDTNFFAALWWVFVLLFIALMVSFKLQIGFFAALILTLVVAIGALYGLAGSLNGLSKDKKHTEPTQETNTTPPKPQTPQHTAQQMTAPNHTDHIAASEPAKLREKQQRAEIHATTPSQPQTDPDVVMVLRIQKEREQRAEQRIAQIKAAQKPTQPQPINRNTTPQNNQYTPTGKTIQQLMSNKQQPPKKPINEQQKPSPNKQLAENIAASIAQQAKASSPTDRSQAELDRWRNKRYGKSPEHKAELGKRYEQYIGYLYEQKGYAVEYHGINNGKNDLGIDLIAKKDNVVLIIQAKCWSQKRHIYHNTLTQIIGATLLYKKRHGKPNEKIRSVVVTSTTLDENQKSVAQDLGVFVLEKVQYNRNYPAIKCKANKAEGTFIYHLPTDQQYDKIIIRPENGDCYAQTTFEAEFKGFRRAYRWRGNQS